MIRMQVVAARVVIAAAVVSLPSLAAAADLVGTVLKGGKPVAGTTVTLGQKNGPARSVNTDTEGRYVFSGVIPGNYILRCNGTEQPLSISDGINRRDCAAGSP
jgi:Carboxypeptidase regulatory-like domain